MPVILSHEIYGCGPRKVLVMHDWFCDHTTWNAALPYLSQDVFTYVFVDFRGYGGSREIKGQYTLAEISSDVLALVDHLEWQTFSVVGHSLSSLVAQHLPQLTPQRIERVVAITPVSPASMQLSDEMREMSRRLALADDERRLGALVHFWGDRLSDTWIKYKAKRWRETADPDVAAAYVDVYGRTDISADAKQVKTPLLVVAAEEDAPPFRLAALQPIMRSFYPDAEFVSLPACGHYPMQEMPPLLVSHVERYLAR